MNNRLFLHRHRFVLLVIVLVVVSFFHLQGTEPEKEETKESVFTHPSFVDEIVVQGEAVRDTATIQQIDWKQIQEKGVKTVAEALQLIPGAYVQTGGKGEAYIYIRGFTQHEVSVLIDGIPLSSPYDGQIDLSSFPLESIERIDVVKGASSLLYGANAMGGVVNIITKKSDGSNHVRLYSQYGSGKSGEVKASLQGTLGKLRYLVTGGYYNRNYFPLSHDYTALRNQGTGERENSDRTFKSGKITLGWDMGQNGQATVSFSHLDQVKGIPHHESDTKAKYWRFTDWQDGIVDFEYHKTMEAFSYKTKFYYQYFNNILNSYDDHTYTTQKTKNAFTDTYRDHSYGGDAFFRLNAGNSHLFKAALRYRQDTHREQSNIGSPWEQEHMNTLSIPLEGEWRPSRLFTVTYGTSVDLMFLDTQQGNTRTATSLNPQVAGIIHFTDTLSFRASAAHKTRFPTLKELFSSTSGNRELDAMKSNIFEAGIEYFPTPRLSLSVVGFYNDVRDLINRVSKDTQYINIDKAVFKGIETAVDWQFLTNSRLSLSYTRLQAEDKTTKNQVYIQYRPKHKIDASLFVALPDQFNFNIDTGYVSSQVYYDSKNVQQTLKSYTRVDMKISKGFGEWLSVFLWARNVFDVNYYETEGYPMEGRVISGGIQIGIL
ncbi:MAG: TonB-dependent receptor plug domain-containing protein [Candidatus Omnitrophota bacterium]